MRSVRQQMCHGTRSNTIIHAHARTVVEEEIRIAHARVDKKLAHHSSPLGEAAILGKRLSQQAQQQFGVQVLAHLVRHHDVLRNGHGHPRRQKPASCERRSHCDFRARRELERLGALRHEFSRPVWIAVRRCDNTFHRDPASHKHILECRSRELSGILNSQWSMKPLRRCRSPRPHEHAPRTAFKTRVRHFSLRCHRHDVLEGVVVEAWCPLIHRGAGLCRISGYPQLDGIFSEAQRRNRRPIAPLQIVPRPRGAVRFAEEIAVVPHHAAFDRAHPRLHHLRCEQI